MPLNFQEFWKLIQQKKFYKADFNSKQVTFGSKQEELQEMYRWKLSFDGYKDSLPAYYNDYLNSFIKFLQMSPALLLPPTEQRLFEATGQSRYLLTQVQEIKHKQKSTEMAHENAFREIAQEHQLESFI
jgi:hypothetical protein